MKVKVFVFSKNYWSLTWKIKSEEVEKTISEWLAKNPDIDIKYIKHTPVSNVFSPAQLFVSIYYS